MIAVTEHNSKHIIQGKNILFLMDDPLNWPIAPKVRHQLAKTDPILLILDWLYAVEQQVKRYNHITGKQEKENQTPEFRLLFVPKIATTLLNRLQLIRHHLKDDPSLTHNDLLKRFFPLAHYGYKKLRQEYGNRCHEAQNRLYMETGYPDFYLEDLLAEEEGEETATLCEALALEEELSGTYETKRTNTIEQEIEGVLNSIDLYALSSQHRLEILSKIVERWPDKKGYMWQGSGITYKIAEDLGRHPVVNAVSILNYVLNLPDVDVNYQWYDPNQDLDKNKQTLLHVLATTEHSDLEELLESILTKGAKLHLQNSQGLTALDKAIIADNQIAILKLLAYEGDRYIHPSYLLRLITAYHSLPTFAAPLEKLFKRNSEAA